jgi:glycosyltransferase involved in cell wall biosynthesis
MIGVFAKTLNPSIVTVHDISACKVTDNEDILFPKLYNFFLRRSIDGIRQADVIICISEFSRDDLIENIDVNKKSVRVIYSGVDHETFKLRDKETCRKELGLSSDTPIILHVGSEIPRKNIPALLKSFKDFQKDFTKALLIRIGPKRFSTQQLITHLNLNNCVRYYNNLSDETLAKFYSAADLFVFPSYYEGFGLPVLEAMAAGCPVIVGNYKAAQEIVGNSTCLVNPFEIENISTRMKEIVSYQSLKNDMIEKELKRSRLFTWERCARETAEVYRDIAKRNDGYDTLF